MASPDSAFASRLVWLVAAAAISLCPALAAAEDSNFRLIDTPRCTSAGLALDLCFSANWGSTERSRKANKGVELALYPSAPPPGSIRQRKQTPFLVTDVPEAGELKIVIPFEALKAVQAAPGKTVNLTGHWANAMAGGAPASHVWGYKVHPVPIQIPQSFAFPAASAQQNAAFHRTPRPQLFGWRLRGWPTPRSR